MGAPPFPQLKPHGRWREGVGIDAKELNAWIVAGGFDWALVNRTSSTGAMQNEGDYVMGDVERAYESANEKIGSAQDAYLSTVKRFKGEIKNDLTAISAAADRVARENEKMRAAYEAAAKTLTSPDMERAIANAERLAAALRSISELQNHSITFAVLDRKPQA